MKSCFHLVYGTFEAGMAENKFKKALFKFVLSKHEDFAALFLLNSITPALFTKLTSNLTVIKLRTFMMMDSLD
jgi:hypothetical protein